jgi:hypothetical protein
MWTAKKYLGLSYLQTSGHQHVDCKTTLIVSPGPQLPHVDEIQMRVVPSELYTNIQSGVACRCIKEEDGIYHYKLHSATSIAVGQKAKTCIFENKKQARAKPS